MICQILRSDLNMSLTQGIIHNLSNTTLNGNALPCDYASLKKMEAAEGEDDLGKVGGLRELRTTPPAPLFLYLSRTCSSVGTFFMINFSITLLSIYSQLIVSLLFFALTLLISIDTLASLLLLSFAFCNIP